MKKKVRTDGDCDLWSKLHESLHARIVSRLSVRKLLELQCRYPRWWENVISTLQQESRDRTHISPPHVLLQSLHDEEQKQASRIWVHSEESARNGARFEYLPNFVRRLSLCVHQISGSGGLVSCIAHSRDVRCRDRHTADARLFVFNIFSGCFKEVLHRLEGLPYCHLAMSHNTTTHSYRILLVGNKVLHSYDSNTNSWSSKPVPLKAVYLSSCSLFDDSVHVTLLCSWVDSISTGFRYDLTEDRFETCNLPKVYSSIHYFHTDMQIIQCNQKMLAVYSYVRRTNRSGFESVLSQLQMKVLIWEFNNSSWKQISRMPHTVQRVFNESFKHAIDPLNCSTRCGAAGDCIYLSGCISWESKCRLMPCARYNVASDEWSLVCHQSEDLVGSASACTTGLVILDDPRLDTPV